jgi:hypothetical protein
MLNNYGRRSLTSALRSKGHTATLILAKRTPFSLRCPATARRLLREPPICPGLDFPGPPVCRPGRPEPPPRTSDNTKGRTCPPDPLQVCGHRGLPLYRLCTLSRSAPNIKPYHQVFEISAEGYGERRASPSLKETGEARRAERDCCCLTAAGGIRFSRCRVCRLL